MSVSNSIKDQHTFECVTDVTRKIVKTHLTVALLISGSSRVKVIYSVVSGNDVPP